MCPWQWNGGWPLHLTRDSPRDEIECPTLDTDRHHLRHLRSRTYMAAVSPWFFTVGPAFLDPVTVPHFPLHYQHYGPDSWNKNVGYRFLFIHIGLYFHQWVYRGDDWLLVRRWEYLLAHRHAIDIVQVISWNGEVSSLM
jgi:glucan endo-1,3-alpha-glucosidase